MIRGWLPWTHGDEEPEPKRGDHAAESFRRRVRRAAKRLLEPAVEEEPQPATTGLLTMPDVLRLAGERGIRVTVWQVRQAIVKGELPVVARGHRGRGRRHLLRVEDVEEWLEG